MRECDSSLLLCFWAHGDSSLSQSSSAFLRFRPLHSGPASTSGGSSVLKKGTVVGCHPDLAPSRTRFGRIWGQLRPVRFEGDDPKISCWPNLSSPTPLVWVAPLSTTTGKQSHTGLLRLLGRAQGPLPAAPNLAELSQKCIFRLSVFILNSPRCCLLWR